MAKKANLHSDITCRHRKTDAWRTRTTAGNICTTNIMCRDLNLFLLKKKITAIKTCDKLNSYKHKFWEQWNKKDTKNWKGEEYRGTPQSS